MAAILKPDRMNTPQIQNSIRQKKAALLGTVFCKANLFAFFALGLYAAGAGFNALVVKDGVLQIRKQTANGSSHTVGAFYSSGINFTANRAVSGHRSTKYLV